MCKEKRTVSIRIGRCAGGLLRIDLFLSKEILINLKFKDYFDSCRDG